MRRPESSRDASSRLNRQMKQTSNSRQIDRTVALSPCGAAGSAFTVDEGAEPGRRALADLFKAPGAF